MKGRFFWDNQYLVAPAGKKSTQLDDDDAVGVLQILINEGVLQGDSDLSSKVFEHKVCRPKRVLTLWKTVLIKKFGAVAEQSPAFNRLIATLSTRSGLAKVANCVDSGCPLEGTSETNQGISECHDLVKTLAKCKAGGLGPPMQILKELPGEPEPCATDNAETRSDVGGGPRGVGPAISAEADALSALAMSFGTVSGVQKEDVQGVVERAHAFIAGVEFVNELSQFEGSVAAAVGSPGRLILLVDAPTSRQKVVGNWLEAVARIVRKLTSKGDTQSVRVIVKVNTRCLMLSKALTRQQELLPNFAHVPVMVAGAKVSQRKLPAFVLVSGKKTDLTSLPSSLRSLKAKPGERLLFRCTERDCPFRGAAAQARLSEFCVDAGEEIAADDKDDADGFDYMQERALIFILSESAGMLWGHVLELTGQFPFCSKHISQRHSASS